MKLLFLTQVLDREDPILGFAHDWVSALARRLERVIVVPSRAGSFDLPGNVEVRSLGKERGLGRGARLARFARAVGGALGRREADAVLAHMVPRLALLAKPFARAAGAPVFLWYTHKGVDWSLRLAAPLVARAFTASERSFRLPSRRKVVVGHGIDVTRFRPPDPGEAEVTHDVVVVGRIAPAKDPLLLVEALGLLKRRGVLLRSLFAGGTLLAEHDAYHERLRRRIAELDLAQAVTFLGPVPYPRVRGVYWRAPIFCSPSRTGSVDKTLLEAMACGRIPVTCNESLADVLGEEAAPFFFPPGDAEALAERLLYWRRAPGEVRLEAAARLRRRVVEEHALERLAERLTAEMAAAVAGRRGAEGG